MSADCFTVVKFMPCLPKFMLLQLSTKQRMLCSDGKTHSGTAKEADSSGELTKPNTDSYLEHRGSTSLLLLLYHLHD